MAVGEEVAPDVRRGYGEGRWDEEKRRGALGDERERIDYDTPWKELLESYLKEFLAFFFPRVHEGVEWDRGHDFLDKELQKVVHDAELGRRRVDKLVRVWRQGGAEQWVLLHIEVQGARDAASPLARRMYTYNYRIFDRYGRKVASLAVLTDDDPTWRPSRYEYEIWGSRVGIQFPLVKLLDQGTPARRAELGASRNPFAVATLAHLRAREKAAPDDRYRYKLTLIKGLYEKGFERQDILNLFRVIDWLIRLPEGLEQRLWQTVQSFEEARGMPYITSVERIGIEKGIEKGIEQERRLLTRLAGRRFGDACGEEVAGLIESLEAQEELQQVADWIIDCDTGDELVERAKGLVGPSDAEDGKAGEGESAADPRG